MLSKLSMAACSGCLLLAGAAPAQAESVEGRLDWAGERGLGLAVAGIVESVAARTGAVVAAGEELLRLDPRPFVARRDLAEAGLQGIAPGAAEAEAEFERAQDLLDRTVISEADFRLAEIAVAQARARLRGAEAELTLADWQLAHSRLVADRPLRVLAVRADVGEVVDNAAGAQVLVVVALAGLEQRQAEGLSPGQSLKIRLGRYTTQGEIVALQPARRGQSGPPWDLRVEFPAPDRALPDFDRTVRIELP